MKKGVGSYVWKCGPWKGHHGILEAQIWEFKCELDYRKEKKGAIWVLNYNWICEPWKGHHWILGKPEREFLKLGTNDDWESWNTEIRIEWMLLTR